MPDTRIVIAGKGGVGKTTTTALLAEILVGEGRRVLAVDGDAQMNLASALGAGQDAPTLAPLARQADYVAEKTGARPGEGSGAVLCLNPDVSDVVQRLGMRTPGGVNLLVMGGVSQAGTGCLCPENTVLSSTLSSMSLRDDDVVLLDTHAGVEHFGRAIARGFDQCVVVADPTFHALQVASDTARLARELGIEVVRLVVNRVVDEADLSRAEMHLWKLGDPEFTSRHALPFDASVRRSEPMVTSLLACASPIVAALTDLAVVLAPRPSPVVETARGG